MTVNERNAWIVENIRFIHAVCQKYRERNDYEDIVQTAILGAIAALDKVDESKGEKAVRAYVAAYVDGYVVNYWIKKSCLVHIPRWAYDNGVRVDCMSIDYEYDDDDTFESLYLGEDEQGYEETEVMTDFKRAISGLSEKVQSTAYRLIEGYTRRDIAEQDGCSQNAVFLRLKGIQQAYRSYV